MLSLKNKNMNLAFIFLAIVQISSAVELRKTIRLKSLNLLKRKDCG